MTPRRPRRPVTRPRQAGSASWLDKHQRQLAALRLDLWRLCKRVDRLVASSRRAERRG